MTDHGWWDQLNRLESMGVQCRDERGRFVAKKSATQKSHDLLVSLLTEDERRRFKTNGHIQERGGVSGWLYDISIGYTGNIVVKGQEICCHLVMPERFPIYDHMIAQLLNIRYNERGFIKEAYTSLEL